MKENTKPGKMATKNAALRYSRCSGIIPAVWKSTQMKRSKYASSQATKARDMSNKRRNVEKICVCLFSIEKWPSLNDEIFWLLTEIINLKNTIV